MQNKPILSTNEESIIEFIKNEPNLNDRLLLIECISKLSSAGIYIDKVDPILAYVQESILYRYDLDEEETDEDYIAKWYLYINDKNIAGTWKEYDLSTCKILEKALKYGIDCVRIDNKHYVDLQSYLQKDYYSNLRIRVKREKAKLQRDDGVNTNKTTINTDNKTITTTTPNNNIDDNLPFVQWYWADDGLRGYQNKWIKYNDEICIKLEKQFRNNVKNQFIMVDSLRYVNVHTMLQIRYDNKTRVRMVKRGEFKTPSKVNLLLYDKISKLFNPKISTSSTSTTTIPSLNSTLSTKPPPLPPKCNYDETISLIPTEELAQVLTFDQAKFLLRKFKESQSFDNNHQTKEQSQQHSALFTHTFNTFKNVINRNNSILLENDYSFCAPKKLK